MKRCFLPILIILFTFPLIAQNQNNNPEITSEEVQAHIEFLSSDALEGRFTGSEKCFEAGEYIKNEFESYGLKPAFGDSFFQEFSFVETVNKGTKNSLSILSNDENTELSLDTDFVPAPFGRSNLAKAELVFAGYGISAPKLNYDDYKNIDVKDKIVVVLRYHPEYNNPHSKFDAHAAFRRKASLAQEKGAVGIIFVNGAFPETSDDKLMEFKYDRAAGVKNIATVAMKRSFLEKLFDEEGMNLSDYQTMISDKLEPASFLFTGITATINTDVEEVIKTARNVGAILEGSDEILKNEFIAIGGHYDHLGFGQHGSLYRGDEILIHNGADDNASGTTGVLEIAEKFASLKGEIKRSIMFFTFSGEELGLLGSNYLVNNFPVPITQVITMINMDMIGRINDENSLTIFGMGTSSIWENLVTEKNIYNLNLAFKKEGYGPSDHSSFYGKEIPVLFFFTGTHPDYHRPSDTADKIKAIGEAQIVNFVYDITYSISEANEKPDYINVPRNEMARGGGWKVYVGTIPDYAYSGDGFKFSGVSKGGPAEKAGLQGGDIMISFACNKINNIYDYVYALKEQVPGDVVEIIVLREGKEKVFQVELGAK